jgi:transcriptional regulator with XRE-family HTH domain
MGFQRKAKGCGRWGGELRQAIRCLRKRLDLNQGEFAALCGWPRNMISQYAAEVARPSAERLIHLLRLAVTDDERRPILKALERYGVLATDLAPALPGFHEEVPVSASMDRVSGELDPAAMSDNSVFADKGKS